MSNRTIARMSLSRGKKDAQETPGRWTPQRKKIASLGTVQFFEKPQDPHSSPLDTKGGKTDGILGSILKSSPPFEKGRTGGISGKAFSKG